MRKFGTIAAIAATSSLLAGGVLAQVNNPAEREILSSDEDALLPPEEWECSLYVEEYEDFLKAGNQPDSWRFVGKRYRAAGDGRGYDWNEWLAWYEDADCLAAAPLADGANSAGAAGGGSGGGSASGGGGLFGGDMTAVGIVGGLVVTGLIAAGGGDDGGSGNSMSPG